MKSEEFCHLSRHHKQKGYLHVSIIYKNVSSTPFKTQAIFFRAFFPGSHLSMFTVSISKNRFEEKYYNE